jgi:hypothetical protein
MRHLTDEVENLKNIDLIGVSLTANSLNTVFDGVIMNGKEIYFEVLAKLDNLVELGLLSIAQRNEIERRMKGCALRAGAIDGSMRGVVRNLKERKNEN